MSLSKYSGKATPSKERIYELLRSPVVTEKSTLLSEHNQVSFHVPMDASKPEIKAAVEDLFKVNVTGVNTLISKGKVKMFRGRPGKRNNTKKAMVSLADGQSIDISTGI